MSPGSATLFPCPGHRFSVFRPVFYLFPRLYGAQVPGYRRRAGVRIKRVPVRGAGFYYTQGNAITKFSPHVFKRPTFKGSNDI